MLAHQSAQITNCLKRAAQSRERWSQSSDPEVRAFHATMEASWTRLAASIAYVERADLFLHTQECQVPPLDLCAACYNAMRLKSAEATNGKQRLVFECPQCGHEQIRNA